MTGNVETNTNNTSLVFNKLYYEVKNVDPNILTNNYRIIESISGKIEAGRLTGVIGNSGCGKTHFLRMIVGDIEENAKTFGDIEYTNKSIIYLPQDDTFYPDLSIYDHLNFYISLKKSHKGFIKEDKIDQVLQACCIDHKKHTLMKSLSGGERKRALIAIAMISEPGILVLDEPTTGLDCNTALEIVYTLKEYAQSTKSIVICTVHQPGSGLFNCFDDIFILSKKSLFYSGPVKDLNIFLDSHGFIKDEMFSVPEFIFNLLSEKSPYKDQVDDIINGNVPDDVYEIQPRICNNTKNIVWRWSYKDAMIMSKYFLKVFFGVPGTFQNFLVWILVLASSCIMPFIHFMRAIFNPISADLNEDLSLCSYWETFLVSYVFSRFLYDYYFHMLLFLNFRGFFQNYECFCLDYINKRYTFGSYFIYTLLINLYWNLAIFYSAYICFVVIYWRILLCNPLVSFFVIIFTFLFAFLYTFISIVLYYLPFLFFYIASREFLFSTLKDKDNNLVSFKSSFKYIFMSSPIYNFLVLMRSKCYGLLINFRIRSLDKLCKFLNKVDVDLVLDQDPGLCVEEEVVYWSYNTFTADCVMIFSLVVSSVFVIGTLVGLYIVFRVPNQRFKLK